MGTDHGAQREDTDRPDTRSRFPHQRLEFGGSLEIIGVGDRDVDGRIRGRTPHKLGDEFGQHARLTTHTPDRHHLPVLDRQQWMHSEQRADQRLRATDAATSLQKFQGRDAKETTRLSADPVEECGQFTGTRTRVECVLGSPKPERQRHRDETTVDHRHAPRKRLGRRAG